MEFNTLLPHTALSIRIGAKPAKKVSRRHHSDAQQISSEPKCSLLTTVSLSDLDFP
jgi:hypothetical protein